MIYQDYMRRKMHNVVKLDTAEGYSLTVYSCANKNLKDYTIYGNTGGVGDKTENLFNCSKTPNSVSSDKIDANFTRNDYIYTVNINCPYISENISLSFNNSSNLNDLKPNTTYTVCVETLGGQISGKFRVYIFSGDTYKQLISIDNSQQGIKKVAKITTTDTDYNIYRIYGFYIAAADGRSCIANNVKLRISFYEGAYTTETIPEYEPYDKYKIPIMVTGNNLFDKAISTNADIKNETTITSSDYSVPILNNNDICKILKPDTTYTISCEFECTAIPSDYTYNGGILGFRVHSNVSGYSSMAATIEKQMLVGERYKFSKTFTTPSNFGTGGNYGFYIYRNHYKGNGTVAASMICRNLQIEEGTSATSYEPYHEPVTTNIFRDAQLGQGESINYKADSLPDIVLKKGTNIITADTEVKPSNIKIKYLKK